MIAVISSLASLFSVTLLLAAGHGPPEPVEAPAPEVVTSASVKVDRSASARKGWETRRKNAAIARGKVVALARA